MLPDDLLRGARGRRLCWELSQAVDGARDELRDDSDTLARRIFDALRRSVDFAMYWQEPDEHDRELSAPGSRDDLRPIAAALAANRGVEWWEGGVDLADQHGVHMLDDADPGTEPPLTGSAAALQSWRTAAEHANIDMRDVPASTWHMTSGMWWSAPIQHEIPVTTRARTGRGPVGLWLVEDSLGWTRATSWPLRPTRPPRVFEITGQKSWADLVRRHPFDVTDGRGPDWYRVTGRRGRWLIPDWASVAAQFDAVHLTVLGYLAAAGETIPIGDDAASLIAGWAPDATFWLSDVLEITGPPTHWVGEHYGEVWRVAGAAPTEFDPG
jgi:hypothetical protein